IWISRSTPAGYPAVSSGSAFATRPKAPSIRCTTRVSPWTRTPCPLARRCTWPWRSRRWRSCGLKDPAAPVELRLAAAHEPRLGDEARVGQAFPQGGTGKGWIFVEHPEDAAGIRKQRVDINA